MENQKKLIRSFGRIKSRKLSSHKKSLLKELLPRYKIQEQEIKNIHNSKDDSENYLEIGFGFGDFIFSTAKQNPKINFFGCEPHLNGVVNLLSKLDNDVLENIKISNVDIRILIAEFPDSFFDKVYILFPDPWPKSKHFKRRLINTKFLDEELAPKLKSKGEVVIATDHDSYKTWILSSILRSQKFLWQAEKKSDWQDFPADWIETKYQKKAAIEGRNSILIKINLCC